MSMKSSIILVIVFGILIAGSLFFVLNKEKVDTSACDAMTDSNFDNKVFCYLDLSQTAKSYEHCEKLKNYIASSSNEQAKSQVDLYYDGCRFRVLVSSKSKNEKECEKFSVKTLG